VGTTVVHKVTARFLKVNIRGKSLKAVAKQIKGSLATKLEIRDTIAFDNDRTTTAKIEDGIQQDLYRPI
jgi:hypothetical protein